MAEINSCFMKTTTNNEEIQTVEMSYKEALKINGPSELDGPFIRFWQEDKLNSNWFG